MWSIGLRRVGLAVAVALVSGATLAGSVTAGAGGAPGPTVVKHSLTGTHSWYAQTYQGRPVLGGFLVAHEYRDGHHDWVDRRQPIDGTVASAASVSATSAEAVAKQATGASKASGAATLAVLPGSPARLVWSVVVTRATGHVRVLVDATTGEVRGKTRLAADANGSGRVFDPNPITTLRDRTLQDQNDSDYPALAGAYRNVTLTHLDGSGFLRGDYAEVGPMADLAFSPGLTFSFGRSSPYFEQTMAYYQVTRAQEYIQSLGFTGPTGINDEPQNLLTDVIPDDNAFYDFFDDTIVFGTGGVDEAEDADIIWHEYGHAIQGDQFSDAEPFESLDMATVGEGFGDYWAATMSQTVNDGFDVPCIAEWGADIHANTPERCDRRVDLNLTLADRTFEPHADGQIWSRALWDMNQALGRDKTNRIILEAQFGFDTLMSLADAAMVVSATAERLYGNSARMVANKAFAARGILTPGGVPHPEHPTHPAHPVTATLVAVTGQAAPGGGVFDGTFEPGGLSKSGAVSFNADLNVGGQIIGEGAFVNDGKSVVQLGRAGGPAPGGGVFGEGTLGQVTLNDTGDTAFSFLFDPIDSPFGLNAGVFARPAGGPATPLVRPGVTPAPGGGVFRGGFEPAINGSRQVAFTALTDTDLGYAPSIGSGVYLSRPGSGTATVAAPGDAVPGGGTIDFAAGPTINAAGDVAYDAHVVGDDLLCFAGFLDCAASVFVRHGGTGAIETIARQGSQVAGDPPGIAYLGTYKPLVNDRGDVLFFAISTDDFFPGIYLRTNGEPRRIVQDMLVPGIGRINIGFPDFRAFAPDYAFNAQRQVAFIASVDTAAREPLGEQVLLWRDGKFSVVAETGANVPGVGTIAEFLNGLLINDSGQILMQVVLEDGRVALLRTR